VGCRARRAGGLMAGGVSHRLLFGWEERGAQPARGPDWRPARRCTRRRQRGHHTGPVSKVTPSCPVGVCRSPAGVCGAGSVPAAGAPLQSRPAR
jgi:hypothetical protein